MKYDRVTSCLPFDVPISAADLEYASERGTQVHKAVQFWEEGRLSDESISDVVRPYFGGWLALKQDVPIEVIYAELELKSAMYGLAGRVDFLGTFSDFPAVMDLKTGAPPDPNTWPLQLAAYERLALDEMKAGSLECPFKRIPKSLKRVVIQVTKDSKYVIHSGPLGEGCTCCDFTPSDFSIYNAYLTVHRYENKENK